MEIDRSANNDDANGHNDPDELADSGELETSAAGNAATDPEDPDEFEASASGNTTATADLEELVRYVASKLVHNPEEVTVDSETRAGTVYVNLRVPEE